MSTTKDDISFIERAENTLAQGAAGLLPRFLLLASWVGCGASFEHLGHVALVDVDQGVREFGQLSGDALAVRRRGQDSHAEVLSGPNGLGEVAISRDQHCGREDAAPAAAFGLTVEGRRPRTLAPSALRKPMSRNPAYARCTGRAPRKSRVPMGPDFKWL